MALSWEIPVSAVLHGVAFSVIALVGTCGGESRPPLITQDQVMMVDMAGPAKQTTALPQRAERTPDPVSGAQTATEPPPNERSDLAFKTPDAKDTKGQKADTDELRKLQQELARQAALKDLTAPLGTTDRMRTDPNGSSEAGTGSGALGDPELARWGEKVKKLVLPNFHPLPSLCGGNPRLEVKVRVIVDGTGRPVELPTVQKPSGSSSFDEAARGAVERAGNLPSPPARYAAGLDTTLSFDCRDA